MTSRRSFPCTRESVTGARMLVRAALAGEDPETLEAAELMTSELASNCVRHAKSAFELVVRSGREIRIEVHDQDSRTPRLLSPTPREVTGRGLQIVAAMSSDWGVIPSKDGKQVWFTLPSRPVGGEQLRSAPAELEGRADSAASASAQRTEPHSPATRATALPRRRRRARPRAGVV
jgi:anti-sigma regulatory factor (Ser/Thr protein kinase)